MPHAEVAPEEAQDWRPLLDRELSALPEKYRAPLVLCELEGRSRREAARQLRVPEGTLSSRLARGRALLAKRLAQCGVSLSGAALAAGLVEGAEAAAAPLLVSSTVKGAASRAVSTQVVALTEGVMKAMLLSKLKVCWVVGLAAVVSTAAGLAYQAVAQEPVQVPVERGISEQVSVRRASDDLEALRLEIEALRKGLQAARERAKARESAGGALGPRGEGRA